MLRNEIVVMSPLANASFEMGRSTSICWAYNTAEARLSIQLHSVSGEQTEICRDVPNHGVYRWTPLGITSGTYRVVIKSNSAEGSSGLFSLREGKPCSNPIALVERILASPSLPSLPSLPPSPGFALSYNFIQPAPMAYALPPAPPQSFQEPIDTLNESLSPMMPFCALKATRHFTYGALVEHQKRTQRPKAAKPCKAVAKTNGPPVSLSASEVRRCLHQMLNEPAITVDQPLPNGDAVGHFAIKYILMHAQRRESKREKVN